VEGVFDRSIIPPNVKFSYPLIKDVNKKKVKEAYIEKKDVEFNLEL
jgi:hypothetical protein